VVDDVEDVDEAEEEPPQAAMASAATPTADRAVILRIRAEAALPPPRILPHR
jgi:hypothetical protein